MYDEVGQRGASGDMGGKQGRRERSWPIQNFPVVGRPTAPLRTRVTGVHHGEPAG